MRQLLLIGAALVCGCASTSEVVPMGNDRYIVSAAASGAASGKQDVQAVKAANAHCAKTGKTAVVDTIERSGPAFGANPVSASVTFTCVPPSAAP